MNFKVILFVILGFFLLSTLAYTHPIAREADWASDEAPDSTHKPNADSAREERERIADSAKESRARIADSTKLARKQKTDSVQAVRKHFTDSTASVRKYHDSKHYKDSVEKSRTAKANKLKNARQAKMDSLTEARKALTDKMAASRKEKTDSIRTIQKRRTDSLARIKKYKTSKRYADSVAIVKHERTDSIKESQQLFRDNLAAMRKHSLDSAKASRTRIMDSVKTVRTRHMDSLKLVRKVRTDSLAKIKKQKEALAKAKEKKKEDSQKLKLEIKMKQKHEAWTNKSMLKKRWSPKRRFFQNSFTHYNYYYNANRKMQEALANMQRTKKENYDSLIGLYPFDPNRDSSSMSSDMDTIVRKISVAIQIHDPRVKWSNDLYLLLGEAYYYRGRYDNAATAFRYIISKDEAEQKKKNAQDGYSGVHKKEAPSIVAEEKKSRFDFLKHKSVHNESILWLARTYTEAHQVENAEAILSLLESDAKLPEDLKGRLAIEKAFANLADNNQAEAVKQLLVAQDDNNLPYWLRMRSAFITAQILQREGEYQASATSYEKVLTYYPKIEMDFYCRKYIAFNKLQAGDDVAEAMKPLKKVLNDGKYVNYYDQVYYVLGQLAIKANQNDQAITYFSKSANTPKAAKKQKAISFAALGDVYYASSNYTGAKSAYDSAAKYASSASKEASVAAAVQRGKGLEEVVAPAKVIHEQDSLMDLAAMTHKEQLSVVRDYLRYLEKLQEDSISNAENSGVAAVAAAATDDDKSGDSWYFSNPTTMSQGSSDFKRKFGNRPLTDNWRRAAAISNSSASSGEDDLATGNDKSSGLPTEESLLARIPNTPQQKDLSAKVEARAYILLAKAYVKQLEDYTMANNTLDTLDMRFPKNNVKEEELYLRYQIAMKQNKLDKAKMYSDELLAKYPTSQYAGNVRPRTSESTGDERIAGQKVADYFDETYTLIMQHQYTEALMRIDNSKKQYNNPTYKKRFDIAEAMANAGSGDFDKADSLISKFMRTYPTDTLTPWAAEVKQHIKEVRNGGLPSWYDDAVLASKNASRADSAAALAKVAAAKAAKVAAVKAAGPVIPDKYAYNADSAHYCIIVLPGIDSRTGPLKQSIKDLNASRHDSDNINVVLDMYSIGQGVLVMEHFPNAAAAESYRDDLLANGTFTGYAPEEIHVEVISAFNYRKMFADKNADTYLSFYSANYK